jgi:hypothetical protein
MCADKTEKGRTSALSEQILQYLATHPRASDTAEGVRHWWLTGFNPSPAEVQVALQALVDAGAIGVRPLPSGSTVYCGKPTPTEIAYNPRGGAERIDR